MDWDHLQDNPTIQALLSQWTPTTEPIAFLPASAHSDFYDFESSFETRHTILQWIKLTLKPSIAAMVAGGPSSTTIGLSPDDLQLLRDITAPLGTRLAVLKRWMDAGSSRPTATTWEDLTPSTRAAWDAVRGDEVDMEGLKVALSNAECEVNRSVKRSIFSRGHTLLTYCMSESKLDATVTLIRECSRVEVEMENSLGAPPSFYAARHGDLACLQALREAGADLRRKNFDGSTPLHGALYYEHSDAALWLLKEADADPHSRYSDGRTPLLFASQKILLDVSALLTVHYNADIHAKSEDGDTPLSISKSSTLNAFFTLWDNPAIQALLSQWTPTTEPIAFLPVSAHSDLYGFDSSFETRHTILQWIKLTLKPSIAAMLDGSLSSTIGLSSDDIRLLRDTTAPLSDRLDVLKRWMDAGSSLPDATTWEDLTPSTRAAWDAVRGDEVDMEGLKVALSNAECEVNRSVKRSIFSRGHTLLTYCMSESKLDAGMTLIRDCGRVDVEAEDGAGVSPGYMAANYYRDIACLQALHEAGADLRRKCSTGSAPLHGALYNEHSDAAMWLLKEAGADPHSRNMQAQTPLFFAAWKNLLDVAALLTVHYKADIHAKNELDDTPLSKTSLFSALRTFFTMWDNPTIQALLSQWTPMSEPIAFLPASAHDYLYGLDSSFETRHTILQWIKLTLDPKLYPILDPQHRHPPHSSLSPEDLRVLRDPATPLDQRLPLLRAANIEVSSPNLHLKIQLLGSSGAGKTSFRRVMDKEPKVEDAGDAGRTRGVDIKVLKRKRGSSWWSKDCYLTLYDFGGHKEYLSVSRQFLTEEAVVCVTVSLSDLYRDSERAKRQVWLWLEHQESSMRVGERRALVLLGTHLDELPLELESIVIQQLMELYRSFTARQQEKYEELCSRQSEGRLPPRPSPQLMAVVGFDAVGRRVLLDDDPLSRKEIELLELRETDVDGLTQALLRGAARCLPGFFEAPMSKSYQSAVDPLLSDEKRRGLFGERWVLGWAEFAAAMGKQLGLKAEADDSSLLAFAMYAEEVGAVLLLRHSEEEGKWEEEEEEEYGGAGAPAVRTAVSAPGFGASDDPQFSPSSSLSPSPPPPSPMTPPLTPPSSPRITSPRPPFLPSKSPISSRPPHSVIVNPQRAVDAMKLVVSHGFAGVRHCSPNYESAVSECSDPNLMLFIREAQAHMLRVAKAATSPPSSYTWEELLEDEEAYVKRGEVRWRYLSRVLWSSERRSPEELDRAETVMEGVGEDEKRVLARLLHELESAVDLEEEALETRFIPHLLGRRLCVPTDSTAQWDPPVASGRQTVGPVLRWRFTVSFLSMDMYCRLAAGLMSRNFSRGASFKLKSIEGPVMHFESSFLDPLVPGRSTKEHVMMWHSRAGITSAEEEVGKAKTHRDPSEDILSFLGEGEVNVMGWHEDVAYESFTDPSRSLLAVRSALCGGGGGVRPLSRVAWEAFTGVTSLVEDVLCRDFGAWVQVREALAWKTRSLLPEDVHCYPIPGLVEWVQEDERNWFVPVDGEGNGVLLAHLLPPMAAVPDAVLPEWWRCSCDTNRLLMCPDGRYVPLPPSEPESIVDFTIPQRAIRWGELIATGGQGEVWQGMVYTMDVVLKRPRMTDKRGDAVSETQQALRRRALMDEAEVMRRIQLKPHTNIAKYYGRTMGVDGEELWVAMEAVKSVYASAPFASSLRDWLDRGDPENDGRAWPLCARRSVAVQVCKGVQHLHTNGFLHLDLKPRNVLLTRSGAAGEWTVKVADLGLCVSEVAEGEWVTGYRGTRGYIAPEVVELKGSGGRVVVDESADVYSVGVILWQLFVGQECLKEVGVIRRECAAGEFGEAAGGVVRRCLSDGVGDVVAALVERCVAAVPVRRPNLKEVLSVLESLLIIDA